MIGSLWRGIYAPRPVCRECPSLAEGGFGPSFPNEGSQHVESGAPARPCVKLWAAAAPSLH